MPSVTDCLNAYPEAGAEAIATMLERRRDDPIGRAAAEAIRHLVALLRERREADTR